MTTTSASETPRRQFRLASLLLSVTLAAAAFAWVRTWEPDNARGMAALLGVFAGVLVPPLVARRMMRSDFFRRRWYWWTVVLALVWLPWSGMIFAVISESIRSTGRDALILITLSWAGLCSIVVPIIAVTVDLALRRFRSERYRVGMIGAISAVAMLVLIVELDYRFNNPPHTAHYSPFMEKLYWVCFHCIWVAPLGASFALGCLTVRRCVMPPEPSPSDSVNP